MYEKDGCLYSAAYHGTVCCMTSHSITSCAPIAPAGTFVLLLCVIVSLTTLIKQLGNSTP